MYDPISDNRAKGSIEPICGNRVKHCEHCRASKPKVQNAIGQLLSLATEDALPNRANVLIKLHQSHMICQVFNADG